MENCSKHWWQTARFPQFTKNRQTLTGFYTQLLAVFSGVLPKHYYDNYYCKNSNSPHFPQNLLLLLYKYINNKVMGKARCAI